MGTGKPKRDIKEKGTFKDLPKENLIFNGQFFYGELIRGSLLNRFEK